MSDSLYLKRDKQTFGYPLLILLLVCSTAICADTMDQDGVVTLTLRVANYEDGPVQIVALKHAEESGKEPFVHLRNTSSVKTSRIWVRAEVRDSSDPKKKISNTNSNIPNLNWPAERRIEPDGDVWAHETVVPRQNSGSTELHPQACAQTVDFKVGHHFGEGQASVLSPHPNPPDFCRSGGECSITLPCCPSLTARLV